MRSEILILGAVISDGLYSGVLKMKVVYPRLYTKECREITRDRTCKVVIIIYCKRRNRMHCTFRIVYNTLCQSAKLPATTGVTTRNRFHPAHFWAISTAFDKSFPLALAARLPNLSF